MKSTEKGDSRSASGMELGNESLVDVIVLMEGLPRPISPPVAKKRFNELC